MRIPLKSKVLNINSPKNTIIATTKNADSKKIEILKNIEGVEVVVASIKESRVDLKFLFDYLGQKGIDSVLVEGGSTLNFSVVKECLVDKVITFLAPKIIGGKDAKTSIGGDELICLQD